jgi:peptidyl-prolyl cis-trans isomerase D
MTPKKYQRDILWTESKDTNVTDEEIEAFYTQNSFNYIGKDGKQLQLDEAKENVISDLKMKKSKKHAQKQYIAYKKGKIDKSETATLAMNEAPLTSEIWKEIETHNVDTILKPKAVANRYATIRISAVIEPREMSFDEARTLVAADYEKNAQAEGLTKLADNILKNFNESNATLSDFVALDSRKPLEPLNLQESLQFLQKLFTSQKEKGIISIEGKVIVYSIVEQKLVSKDKGEKSDFVKKTADQIKGQDFQSNLLKSLEQKYTIEKFVGGI